MRPPVRMLDDASLPRNLRADLEIAVQAPCPYDLNQGLLALEAALKVDPTHTVEAAEQTLKPQAGEAASGGNDAEYVALSHAKELPWLLKLVFAALGGASIVGVAALGWQHLSWRPEHPAPPQSEHATTPLAPPLPAREADDAIAGPPPDARQQAPGKDLSPSQSAARRELLQLVRIKELLTRDPQAAYRLAQASQREFPRGSLREEREGLSVLLLWRSGRRSEARAAALIFLARYAQSPLRAQVQRVLDEQAAAP